MDQLNKLMEQTNAHAASVKKTLDNIKTDNEAYQQKHAKEGASAKLQMRQNLYQTYARKFHQVLCAVCLLCSLLRADIACCLL